MIIIIMATMEHGGSSGVIDKKNKSPSQRCTLPCRGNTDASAVEGKKLRTVNSEKWRTSDSSSLTAAGGAILQWREYIPSYSSHSDDD